MVTTIMITGVGGQGTILAGDVVARVAAAEGHDVKLSEVHGMSQRGGSVDTVIRFGDEVFSPLADPGAVDVLISFELLEAARWIHYLSANGYAFVNSRRVAPLSVMVGDLEYPEKLEEKLEGLGAVMLDADSLACEAGSPKSANIVVLGAASTRLPFSTASWREVIEGRVPPKTIEANLAAFDFGRSLCSTEGSANREG